MNINHPMITEKQPEERNSSKWLPMQRDIAEMHRLYGNAEQFLTVFSPALQITAARNPERAYCGTAPALAVVAGGYGEPVAVVWICIQLENVNLFAGVKEKMPVERQKELARLILTEYPFLKVTELLLFFHRLKCGRYGRFYGSVDALFITTSLLQFMDERRKETTRYKVVPDENTKTANPATGGITYDEYLLLKQKKSNTHENN